MKVRMFFTIFFVFQFPNTKWTCVDFSRFNACNSLLAL
jgi:hypothetical protein